MDGWMGERIVVEAVKFDKKLRQFYLNLIFFTTRLPVRWHSGVNSALIGSGD